MGDIRKGYAEFTDRLRGVVQTMAEDGVPDDQIRSFIEKQKAGWSARENEARAGRMEAVQGENTLGSAFKEGLAETGRSLKDRLVAMARGGKKLATLANAGAPIQFGGDEAWQDLKTNPAAQRELGRGLSDTMFGLPAKISDAIRKASGKPATYAENEATDPQEAPDYRSAGMVGGSLIPAGPLTQLGRGSLALTRGLAAPVRTLAAPVLASTAYATTHAALSPNEDILPSRDPKTGEINPGAALAAASDPMNVAVPAVVAAGRGTSNLLRSNPTIGRYARAKEGGAYEKPDMKALPPGQEGMQKAQEQGLDRIVNRDRELAKQASDAYHASVEPELAKPIDTDAMRMRLLEGRQGNIDPDSGLPIRPEVDAAYNRAFDRTPEQATVRGTLMRRRGLQQDAAFGAPSPTEAQSANRDVYQTFRQAVRDASPEVASADDAYTAHARQAARRSDILFNTEENVIPSGGGGGFADARPVDADPATPTGAAAALEGPADMRVSKARSAATTLGRIDDTNVPGLRAARFLEELAGQDPEFQQALEFIANKKAYEGTRFGLPQLPTSLTGATSFAGKLPFAQQNARAIGARVLDPAAQAAGALSPGKLKINPIMQAYMLDQERKRKLAQALTGQK
jgi:hypothetical protein